MTSDRETSSAVTPLIPARSRSISTLDGRVIERLGVLEVAKRGDLRQLVADLRREGPVVREVRAADGDLDGRRRAEAHDVADDVGRLERELHARHRAGQLVSEPALERLDINPGLFVEGDAEEHLLGPAGPLINGVDRVSSTGSGRRSRPRSRPPSGRRPRRMASSASRAICSVFSIRVPAGALIRS